MIIVTVFAAKWITRNFDVGNGSGRLAIGLIALGLLLAAEVALGVALRGISAPEALAKRDPFLAATYYGAIALFAFMPWVMGRLDLKIHVKGRAQPLVQ